MHFIGPASPIVEDFTTISNGLEISWKSDVTSKQEKYVVAYIRNDTNRQTSIDTTLPKISLTQLYPGAGYTIKVYAQSHKLLSEPYTSFRVVYPNPPRNLSVKRVLGNKVTLEWEKPLNSLYTGYMVRYRPEMKDRQPRSWTEIPDISEEQFTLND